VADRHAQGVGVVEDVAVDDSDLQGVEERFDEGIVADLARALHALGNAQGCKTRADGVGVRYPLPVKKRCLTLRFSGGAERRPLQPFVRSQSERVANTGHQEIGTSQEAGLHQPQLHHNSR